MTVDMEALARRAVACKHWRWMPGMRATDAVRCLDGMPATIFVGRLPDLDDLATLGCIEHGLLPQVWGEDVYLARIDCAPAHSNVTICWRWTVILPSIRGSVCGLFEAKAEALVAALEDAP